MPARTLSSEPELLSPLRYAPYVQSPPPFDHPEQPRPDLALHHHNRSYPPNVAHIHRNQQGITRQDYVYPAMAPPMQRTDDLAFRVYPVVPSQWSTHSSSLAPGWLPHHPTMARIPPMAPPPALLHKVWIVDCKACDTFLTNRGMKAVLLLHPSVPLYSTDAMPVNCSAQSVTAEATASSSSRTQQTERPRPLARTCECLTQTLWCHGCGTAVGYMIVSPCLRCTSSITPNNRSTNGHRFVFYSAEIIASERHYVPDESGINAEAQFTQNAPPPSMPRPSNSPQYTAVSPGTPRHRRHDSNSDPFQRNSVSSSSSTPRSSVEPSSPSSAASFSSPPPLVPLTPPRSQQHGYSRLREGDVVFWHHLVRNGEISAVQDDPRARAPTKETSSSEAPPAAKDERREFVASSRKTVAGR